MSWNPVVVILLLISAAGLAGCTGSPAAPPAPVPAATTLPETPAPVTTAPAATTAALTPAPPVPGPAKTYTFDGTGDSTETFTTATDRTWVFRMSSSAKEIFMVTIKDRNGNTIDVLADATDAWAGTESVTLKAGTYYLAVAADAPWSVTVSTE